MAPSEATLVDARDAAWREYLLAHADALPYHHPAWLDTLAEVYGYEPRAAVVRAASGEIAGGIPLVEVGGRIRARRWISLPFTDLCPPLAGPGVDEHALGAAVEQLRSERGVSSLEIRAPLAGSEARGEQRGVRHVLQLRDPDELFAAFRSQVRRNIRKAEKSGVEIREAGSRDDLVRTYFALHADTRRRLGVPPQPRRFFDRLWHNVVDAGLGYLLLAYHGGTAIAGAVFLEWNGHVVYKYGASDREHWPLRPNNLLFWECIRRSAARGARTLDFGRTDLEDEGLRAFKESWGAPEQPLVYTSLGRARPAGAGHGAQLLRPLVKGSPSWVGRMVGAALYRLAA